MPKAITKTKSNRSIEITHYINGQIVPQSFKIIEFSMDLQGNLKTNGF